MAVSVTMPALGESVTEGTVTRWLKQEGDHVEADEPLLEVSTDKVDTEIPSPASGVLTRITAAVDETIPVGAELAVISDSTPTPTHTPTPTPVAAVTPTPVAAPVAEAAAAVAADVGASGPYVTPLVRKMAAEAGVDLASVRGTGAGGRVRKQDILDAAAAREAALKVAATSGADRPSGTHPAAGSRTAAPPISPLRGTSQPMSRLRRVIAERMVSSLRTTAQLTTVVEVDVTSVARLRERVRDSFLAREGVKLSFLPFFAKAAVEALKTYPTLNASIVDDTIVYPAAEHLGIAVDTDRGLLVPVIHDAGDLNIAGFARRIADLADRTRSNRITPDELGGGTFSITNTGSRGALFDTPIINPPQVAILGTGVVVKRPTVVEHPDLGETLAVRHIVMLALSYDHRLVDGADAARFLVAMKLRLEAGTFDEEVAP